ncbi:NACHT, LRR and PYD domains-containing protein 3-like [Mantella aurantiaca]
MATPPREAEEESHFVDEHKEELIRGIRNVEVVISKLMEERLLISEQCEAVRTRTTSPERMSKLFTFIQDWSRSQKDKFYQTLKNNYPATVGNMERRMPERVTHEEREEYIERHKEYTKCHFEQMKDRNSRLGESSALRRRYTKLVLLRKFRDEEEKKRELSSSGEEHVQLLIDRSSEDFSPTSIEQLFDPDDNGVVPKTVVLHGPAGIGKSVTAHKISLDWATLHLYQDKFDFLFYVSYKDLEKISSKVSLAGLLSKICRMQFPVKIMRNILGKGEKVGFIVNGFDEVKWTLKDQSRFCTDPFKEIHKEVLLRSLLKGQLVKGASLIVTTRPFAMDRLRVLLPDPPRLVEIVGYTGEARENYIRVYFGRRDTEKAVDITRKNPVLFTLCTVPFMCWVVSTVSKQMINKYPSNFTTDTSMFLYYLKGLIKYHSRNDAAAAASMRKVCAVANEGVLNQKVLFEEEDLRRHKLSISSVESVFLSNNIFHGDNGKRTCYSFIHRSFQELLAAVHYALPGEGERGKGGASGTRAVRESSYLPEICKGRSLMDLLEKHPHLALPVRFLFGLVNQVQNKDFTKTSGCSVSFQATTAMIQWLFGGEVSEFDTEHMRFLYETRDDEFMQYVAARAVDLTFSQCQKPDNWLYQLAFCLKACAGRKVTLSGYALNREDLLVLIPLLKKCPQVCFRSCRFAADINSSAGWKNSLFTSLITQDSKIEELSLLGCTLPSSTCEVLDNASKQSHSLTTLYVMFKVNTKEEGEEMRRYFEAFKAPDCTMSTRKMMGKTLFLLRCKRQKIPFYEMGHHMRWDMYEPEEFPFNYHSRILFSHRHL